MVMRTLLRPGRNGVLVKVEEQGWTSFVLAGPTDKDHVYLDLTAALTSFEDVERGAATPRILGERRRPLFGRLLRRPASKIIGPRAEATRRGPFGSPA